jgi:hypothetical protein
MVRALAQGAQRRDASRDASCSRWLFWSVSANWSALAGLNRLAQPKTQK